MRLSFSKMQGLGNDFVLLDGVRAKIDVTAALVQRLADRHYGVGCDQLLLIEPTDNSKADFRYRIFNGDGGEVQQCGNGSRCVARYLRDESLVADGMITVETAGGLISMQTLADGTVRVNMGVPDFSPAALPMLAPVEAEEYGLQTKCGAVRFAAVSMGNPHAVLRVDDLRSIPVSDLGPAIGTDPFFPEGVNVGFMQIVTRERIRLRVYERGAGETLACGTGACAAMVTGRARNDLASTVTVTLPGGELLVEWDGKRQPVWMTGPAIRVFDGQFHL